MLISSIEYCRMAASTTGEGAGRVTGFPGMWFNDGDFG
jgi:hypothetical protein